MSLSKLFLPLCIHISYLNFHEFYQYQSPPPGEADCGNVDITMLNVILSEMTAGEEHDGGVTRSAQEQRAAHSLSRNTDK